MGQSPAWLAVIRLSRGSPAPSMSWWIFVLSPPRGAPDAVSGGLFARTPCSSIQPL